MVSIKNVSHTFSKSTVISYPDWEVAQGGHSLLLGGSGSGKTTLLHLLAGLIAPQQGTIEIAGKTITGGSVKNIDVFRGKYIGLVFQQPHLIDALSVIDNLKLAQYMAQLPQDTKRINEVLASLGLDDKVNAKVYNLSQGQQQRVAIARAVLNKPSIILADEPTASLDDDNALKVLEILEKQAAVHNATLIIATHDSRIKQRIKSQLEL